MIHAAEAYASYSSKARITHPHGAVVIELKTDSEHLDFFFRHNWRSAESGAPVDGRIIALRGDAQFYGLDRSLDGARYYFRPGQQMLYLAHDAYANLKVTIRGLCSEIGDARLIWLHGCSLRIDLSGAEHGIILLGRSGGGKTTITAALRRKLGNRVKVINDDWGAASLDTLTTVYTDEQCLHMKYMSVNSHDPRIRPSPEEFPSEHYRDDSHDPVPRLLIPRSRVFGQDGVAEHAPLTLLVLLRRAGGVKPGIARLGDLALTMIERGEYSDYYDSVEQFFNGSLFLPGEAGRDHHRKLYATLLDRTRIVEAGNVEAPDRVAARLIDYIEELKSTPADRHVSPGPRRVRHFQRARHGRRGLVHLLRNRIPFLAR